MLLIIKFFAKILKILNSEVSPNQIAAGFAFGALIGLIPTKGFLPVFLLFISFIININLAIATLATCIFKLISYLIDPLANQLGYSLLVSMKSLKPFWTKLMNTPVVPYTRFNNTLVLGSFVIGLILQIPLFLAFRWFVLRYRLTIQEKVKKWKIVQAFQATSLYRLYDSYQSFRGQ